MAGRAVLQMDQTTPADKGLFRHVGKRGEDPNLDCRLSLRLGCNRQKASELVVQLVRNSTDFEFDTIRESTIGSTAYKNRVLRNSVNTRKSAVFI